LPMILPLEVKDAIQVQAVGSRPTPYCDSRIEEMAADELIISWPTHAGERIPMRELQAIRISFSRNQEVFEFDATVLDVIDDPVPLLSVRPAGMMRKIQRREDVRVRAHALVELMARVVGLARYKDIRNRSYNIKGETVTLSAGGFAIHHSATIATGTLFEAKLTLPGESKLTLNAQVVRCELVSAPDDQPPTFEVGFSFTRLPQAARARIVRFVFGLQREERLDD
jgi:c-di-GMP-binding flagellar brake protein YcgR